jgi:triosephosphate isomerase
MGRSLERLGKSTGVAVALAPSTPDIGWLSHELSLPIVAQHVDARPAGAFTGRTVVESLRAAGASGSLVNHSEYPLSLPSIRSTLERLRTAGLAAVLCAGNLSAVRRLARLRPPFLAIEPPELIGGQRSVSSARPEVISETVRWVRRLSPSTHVLCGAGIHDREDVRKALELGSEGILVASAVTLNAHPGRAIRELLAGF